MRLLKQIFFLFSLLPVYYFSQGPGYIGKKSVAGYGFEISPSIKGATFIMPVNFTQQLYFEQSAKTTVAIGTSVKYAFTKYDNKARVGNIGSPSSDYTIHAVSFIPYIKLFPKKFVAPWGKYWALGAVWNASISKHDPYMFLTQTINDHDTLLMDFGPDKQLHNSLDFMIGKGRSRVMNNKFLIDYGYNFQIISIINTLIDNSLNGISQKSYIKKTAIDRVRGLNSFNLFFKFGYLF